MDSYIFIRPSDYYYRHLNYDWLLLESAVHFVATYSQNKYFSYACQTLGYDFRSQLHSITYSETFYLDRLHYFRYCYDLFGSFPINEGKNYLAVVPISMEK